MDIRGHVVSSLWTRGLRSSASTTSVTFDRGEKKPLHVHDEGRRRREEVAETDPGALARLHIDSLVGFQPFRPAGWSSPPARGSPTNRSGARDRREALTPSSAPTRCSRDQPADRYPAGEVKALDSKFTVDDNALYRHTDIAEMRDPEAGDQQERLAREKGVTYVKLDGEIGILGNGAGLVMSTLDVIDQVGGRPANFCDLGGGGDAEGVVDALEVITADAQVEAILFNIFGGITRGDEVARGILEALDRMTIDLPIVVRLDGTNAAEGRAMLADAAPPNLYVEETMLSAAERVVELAKERR
jgi:succinyl-CoA synthetase beta subunit